MKQAQRQVNKIGIAMNSNSFDPLDFVEQYQIPSAKEGAKIKKRKEEEAKIIAKAIQNTKDDSISSFATKDDLKILELSLKSESRVMEQRLNNKISKMAITIISSITGIFGVFCGILFFLLKLASF